MNAAEILIDTPIEGGVEIIFGLPGDGINGIIEALRKRQQDIRFIQARHDEAAMLPPKRREEYMKHLGKAFATGAAGQSEIEERLGEEAATTSLKP